MPDETLRFHGVILVEDQIAVKNELRVLKQSGYFAGRDFVYESPERRRLWRKPSSIANHGGDLLLEKFLFKPVNSSGISEFQNPFDRVIRVRLRIERFDFDVPEKRM